MHKKIIAGVMSILICTAALTPDTGVLNQYSADTAVAVENENAAPLITAIPADEDIIETVKIGPNINGYIYSNGLLRIHGYGLMDTSTKCPFKNAELVTQILFENEDPDNGRVITKIGDFAFSGFKNLTSSSCDDITKAEAGVLVIPDSVTIIGGHSFDGCSSVKEIKLGNRLERIWDYAFSNCSGITELVIPDSVKFMCSNMLKNCFTLESLNLPYAASSKEPATAGGEIDEFSSVSDLFMAHAYKDNDPNYFKEYSISKIVIRGGDKVPDYAFASLSTLKEIDLSGTMIDSIGESAFKSCLSLETIKFPESLKSIGKSAFAYCSKISDLSLNYGLETIETRAFDNCTGLKELVIPDSVTSMGTNMLNRCTTLESLQIPYAATNKNCSDAEGTIDEVSSVSDLFINHGYKDNDPNNFTDYSISRITVTGGEKIPDYAFASLSTLKEIDLSKSKVTSIGDKAFSRCHKLENVILNDNIESIGSYAYSQTAIKALPDNKMIKTLGDGVFEDCEGLGNITIPESYQTLGNNVFRNCKSITELVIPENITSMGTGVFNGCTELKTLTLPYAATSKDVTETFGKTNELTSVSDLFINHGYKSNDPNNFDGYSISKIIITGGSIIPEYAFASLSTLKEIDFSQTKITNIGDYAYLNCLALETIEFPETLKWIGKNAFENCTSMSDFNLNYGLETIDTAAFKNCTGIKTLVIPDSVTTMSANMLNGCTNLETLQIPFASTRKSSVYKYNNDPVDTVSSVSDLFIIHGYFDNDPNIFSNYSVSRIIVTGGETIPDYAFAGFSALTEIDLSPTKAEFIGKGTFKNCINAEKIILPATVKSIDESAFAGSNSDVYIYDPECTVSETAFSDDYSGTIHGMTESVIKSLSDSKEYKFDALDDEIIIGPVNLTLTVGETYKVNSNKKDLKFTSSDPEVVKAEDDGTLKAEKEGKATVEVKADKDQSSMNIWVRNPYVTEPAVTTTESVTTPAAETEPAAVTTTEAVTTTVIETETTTVTTVTSAEPVTTTTSETTVTSTEAVTTTTSETTVTSTEPVTTTASETTTAAETDPASTDIEDPTDRILFNIASLEEFSEWAKNDYAIRTGKEAAEAVVIPVTAKYYKIEIKDESGNILDTYSINPKIGIGTNSDNEVVNLPQTGNNSRKNLFTAFAALLMTLLGAAAMKFSGIFDRRRKSDK